MTDLSPAAHAVLDAATDVYWDWSDMSPASPSKIAAAALRAAADQVAPREPAKDPLWASDAYRQRADTRAYLLAIAAELEAHQ